MPVTTTSSMSSSSSSPSARAICVPGRARAKAAANSSATASRAPPRPLAQQLLADAVHSRIEIHPTPEAVSLAPIVPKCGTGPLRHDYISTTGPRGVMASSSRGSTIKPRTAGANTRSTHRGTRGRPVHPHGSVGAGQSLPRACRPYRWRKRARTPTRVLSAQRAGPVGQFCPLRAFGSEPERVQGPCPRWLRARTRRDGVGAALGPPVSRRPRDGTGPATRITAERVPRPACAARCWRCSRAA